MNTIMKQTLLLALCISALGNTACTSMQTAHGSSEAVLAHNIGRGDKVTIIYEDGRTEDIRVSAVDDQQITGMAEDGRQIVAPFDDVANVTYKKVEVAKTTGAVLGGAVVGAVLLGAAAVGVMAGAAGGY